MTHGTAKYIEELEFMDPEMNESVGVTIYRDSNTGQFFGVDTAFLINEDPQFVKAPWGSRLEIVEDYD